MFYLFFVFLFFLAVLLSVFLLLILFFKPPFCEKHKAGLIKIYSLFFIPYLSFVFLACGPHPSDSYPSPKNSFYRLPWERGVQRWVIQGNNGFTTHRDFHKYAWDFLMPNGTKVLASRAGKVIEIVDHFDGVGWSSNFIHILHEDGQVSGYAHIQKGSSLVQKGDWIDRGEVIARSGMVGQTLFPHLHFYVIGDSGESSVPISFKEGLPKAGWFYVSENKKAP